MFGKILDKANQIKAKIKKDDLQLALLEATTDQNWQASTTVLHDIASAAYNYQKMQRINQFLEEKLREKKNWKKLLKALNIIEFLLKNGPQTIATNYRYQLSFLRTLLGYKLYEGDTDRGAPIRERAKAIVDLLENEEFLEDERVSARRIRERMAGVLGGKAGTQQAPGKYESYSSQTFNKMDTKNDGFFKYGGFNYGDRKETNNQHQDVGSTIEERFKPNHYNQPKPEQDPPKPIQPIKEQIVEKEQPKKKAFESMAQKLINPTKKAKQSNYDNYKKSDNNNESLIDTQANFFENKYGNIHTINPPVSPSANHTPIPVAITSTVVPVSNVEPIYINSNSNNNQLNSIDFLGVSSVTPTTNTQANTVSPTNNIQKAATTVQPNHNIAVNNATPLPPTSTLPPNYIPPVNHSYVPYNPYIPPVNSFVPSYNSSNTTTYNIYNGMNPYYPNQPQQPQQPYYNSGNQYNPYPIYSTPSSYNPYPTSNSAPSSNFTLEMSTPKLQPQKIQQKQSQVMKKVNWMSNQQKSLTDLGNLEVQMKKESPKKQVKESGNNIVMDQWAW